MSAHKINFGTEKMSYTNTNHKFVFVYHKHKKSFGIAPIFVTVSKYIVSNQLIAGSIMVRHLILVLVLSLPLRVYYLMRCTHNALWGVIMNSFDSTMSYFGCVSCFWQDLQDSSTGWYVHTCAVLHRLYCLLET